MPDIVRIDDEKNQSDYADRYNNRFILKPGMNHIKIYFDSLITSGTKRALNFRQIYRFLIFMVNPSRKHVLYFDYIRLI